MVGKNLIVQNNGYPEDDVDEEEQPSTSQKIESVPDEPHTTETGQQLAEQAIALQNGLQQHTVSANFLLLNWFKSFSWHSIFRNEKLQSIRQRISKCFFNVQKLQKFLFYNV